MGGGGGGGGGGKPQRQPESKGQTPDVALAVVHAECAICFEPLCDAPCCVFGDHEGARTCRHYFHSVCTRGLVTRRVMGAKRDQVCPLCRAPYSRAMAVPDCNVDPKQWFKVVDYDGDGSLDMDEVLGVLKATIPTDHAELEAAMPELWPRWDPNGDGCKCGVIGYGVIGTGYWGGGFRTCVARGAPL